MTDESMRDSGESADSTGEGNRNRAARPDAGSDPSPEIPIAGLKVPLWISLYHVLYLLITAGLIASPWGAAAAEPKADWRFKLLLVAAMGAAGGALNASRRVVLSVRYRRYLMSRVPWQMLTPVHSAVLASIAFLAIEGGLLSLANSGERAEPRYTFFIMSFSFLVGFVSEVFVKRLIAAADALFGEAAPADPEPTDDSGATGSSR